MLSSYMGAIQKYELSSDDCSQEAGRLLNELDIIMYSLDLEGAEKPEWKKRIFEKASEGLKIFMVRNVGKEETEEEMREKLLVLCKQEEEKRRKDKEYKEMLEAITNTVKEVMKSNVVEEKKTA